MRPRAGEKRREIIAIIPAANLDSIELRQQPQLVAKRTQVFPAGLRFFNQAGHVRQTARDRLEVDVVLEQDAGDASKLARVLPHHRVFELQHVDPVDVNLAVNQPGKIAVAEFAHGVRLDGPESLLDVLQDVQRMRPRRRSIPARRAPGAPVDNPAARSGGDRTVAPVRARSGT